MVFILFPLSSVGFSCENPTEAVEAAAQGLGHSKLWNWVFSPPCFSSGMFEIAEASGVRPGTKIIIHLKSDCKDFANESRVQGEDSWAWMGSGGNAASHSLPYLWKTSSCQPCFRSPDGRAV